MRWVADRFRQIGGKPPPHDGSGGGASGAVLQDAHLTQCLQNMATIGERPLSSFSPSVSFRMRLKVTA